MSLHISVPIQLTVLNRPLGALAGHWPGLDGPGCIMLLLRACLV
jgi:hypothetical protein